MTRYITHRAAPGTWVVRAAGAVLGETSRAIELNEGSYPPVIYFPRDDLAMAMLDQTDHGSHCPHKGDATYFTIQGKSGPLTNAAWSYETPLADVRAIKDHIAFYPDKVTVEQV